MSAGNASPASESATYAKIAWRLIPLLFIGYFAAFLDRVNVGFAKLQMAGDLGFSDAVYGFGAGVFFISYFVLELPSNLILVKIGARKWIARIMVTWGLVSSAFVFTGDLHWGPIAGAFGCNDAEFSFYFLRFLLGAVEAGFYPGVLLYLTFWFPDARRAQMLALFMVAIAVSNALGGPLSGAIMQLMNGTNGLRAWQWLFLIEGIPSVLVGILVFCALPDGPKAARWLSDAERAMIVRQLDNDESGKAASGRLHNLAAMFRDPRIWLLALIYFCGIICSYGITFWMPTIIQEFGVARDDFLKVGLLSMGPWSIGALVQVLWARHSDRTGERRWHSLLGLLIAAAGLVLLAVAGHSSALSLIALTLATVGLGCWIVTFWSLPTAFLSSAAAAGGIAWINSLGNLGGYFGPDLIGRVRTASGGNDSAAFLALAAICFLGVILTLVIPIGMTKTRAAPVERKA